MQFNVAHPALRRILRAYDPSRFSIMRHFLRVSPSETQLFAFGLLQLFSGFLEFPGYTSTGFHRTTLKNIIVDKNCGGFLFKCGFPWKEIVGRSCFAKNGISREKSLFSATVVFFRWSTCRGFLFALIVVFEGKIEKFANCVLKRNDCFLGRCCFWSFIWTGENKMKEAISNDIIFVWRFEKIDFSRIF